MAALAGLRRSFARAESLLRELSGRELDDDTIRRVTRAAARQAAAARAGRGDAARFAEAGGAPEVAIDAGEVNTLTGRRDVAVAVISRRGSGEPARPAEWDTRLLPTPTTRTVVAAVADCGAFGERLRVETDRVGVATASDATVLADGGEWIRNPAALVLPLAAGVPDICHAIEHAATAARATWGDGADAARRRSEGVAILVAEGTAGIGRRIGESVAAVPAGRSPGASLGLAGYLANHPTRLDSAGRLSRGRSIGSGRAEGAIKELVNLRLKRTGARWRVGPVGPLVELIALSDTPEWNDLWIAA